MRNNILSGVSALAIICSAAPAMAQESSSAYSSTDIVVTARKRDETLMQAPVILQAIDAQRIEDMHVTSMLDLSATSPGLNVTYGFASTGVSVSLRGLGNGSGANYVDQTVGLAIDGAGMGSGLFYRGGAFDLGQIEVLKGPQALYYGKSTSAGLISLRTADPTKRFESGLTAGYEFDADEFFTNAYVSGPISDDLGVRVAGYYRDFQGYLTNPNPTLTGSSRRPTGIDYGGRLTLKYDPASGPRLNLKITGTHDDIDSWQGELNQSLCPSGRNPAYPYDNCKIDTVNLGQGLPPAYNPALDYSAFNVAAFAQGSPSELFRDPRYSKTTTFTAILIGAYDATDSLTLDSVSAYGSARGQDAGQSGTINLGIDNLLKEYSQELRLSSNSDSMLNFMVGGLYNYQTRDLQFALVIPFAGVLPPANTPYALYSDNRLKSKSTTWSGFGELTFKPAEQIELSAGLRYTKITKDFTSAITSNNYPSFFNPGPSGETIQNVPRSARRDSEDNFSPEVTLSYRPTQDLTAFISYKQGYKGPGYNASLTATTYTGNNISSFGGETVEGVEGGVKAYVADRQLALTALGYRYDYKGLQVSFVDVDTSTTSIQPAADARVQGVELSADFTPRAIPGLSMRAFVNYNDTHYSSFPDAPCYGNQPASAGCITIGTLRVQDLTGETLHHAPKWTGNLGIRYETNISSDYIVSFDVSSLLSSKYYATPERHPLSRQKGYATLDLTAHLMSNERSWDFSITCRNCTNKLYITNGLDGNTDRTRPDVISTFQGVTTRPRQVLFQLTIHPERF